MAGVSLVNLKNGSRIVDLTQKSIIKILEYSDDDISS